LNAPLKCPAASLTWAFPVDKPGHLTFKFNIAFDEIIFLFFASDFPFLRENSQGEIEP